MDEEKLLLDPFPLLAQDGSVRWPSRHEPVATENGDSVSERDRAEMISRLRGLHAAPTPRPGRAARTPRSATSAAPSCPPTTATCSSSSERRILCACEPCWALRSGDPDCARPAAGSSGSTTSRCPTSSGRSCRSRSGSPSSCARRSPKPSSPSIPSPAGATESELDLDAWEELERLNPVADRDLEPDAEALIVNRMADPHEYVIAPIDECYRLVGAIKIELGGDLGRPGAASARCPRSSTSCAAGRGGAD